MRNLLVGNGLNCQFDNKNYTSQQIVLRILKDLNSLDFPAHIIAEPQYYLRDYLGQLFLKSREILLGDFDNFTVCKDEKESLISFKEKYGSKIKRLRMTDICFEDYYLLHDLLCHSINLGNPNQYIIRESMRLAYLLAIYNNGELNRLHCNYSNNLKDYLLSFDRVFTTNYDLNIENAVQREVIHLHGQFDRLSDVYDENSLRNKLEDAPLKDIRVDPKYIYLYCNAITTHSGAYKELMINQNSTANNTVLAFSKGYNSDLATKEQVDSWLLKDNLLLRNFANAIIVKANNPEISFTDNYHFDLFKNITGDLELLGISPWNDFHIFRTINEANLDRIIYYYHSENSQKKIEELLPLVTKEHRLIFIPITEFWEERYG